MLNLASSTPRSWVEAVANELGLLLIDHAHCEKKAASTAINLIFRYPDRPRLLRVLSALAREELEHFELVLDLLESRGHTYDRLHPSPYAGQLMKLVRRDEPERLVDTLLCCALIEARSCERMKLLSEHLLDAELATFYGDLLASEARHHHVYVELAMDEVGREATRERLTELARAEAEILATCHPAPPLRMHSAS